MKEMLKNYLMAVSHPFLFEEKITQEREQKIVLRSLPDSLYEVPKLNDLQVKELEFAPTMAISWVFVCVRAFYSLLSIVLSVQVFDFYQDGGRKLFPMLFSTGNHVEGKMMILLTLAEIIFFPLTAYVYVGLWKFIIKLCGRLFGAEGDLDEKAEQVAHHSLASHCMLIVPVFGNLAHYVTSSIIIYAGMRCNLKLSRLQSLFVLLGPFIAVFLLSMLLFFSAMILLGSIGL